LVARNRIQGASARGRTQDVADHRLRATESQLRGVRARLSELRQKGDLTPEQEAELKELESRERRLSGRRDAFQQAAESAESATEHATERATRALGELEAMNETGNLSDDDIHALVAHLRKLCCAKN
jgi:TolA-binding protein